MIIRLFFIFISVTINASPVVADALRIAVVDTGCDFDHELLDSYIRIPTLKDGKDQSGHGTHIAGIIVHDLKKRGLDKDLEIVPIRFFNEADSDSKLTLSFANALRRAIDQNVNIIHVSAGGPQSSQEEWELLAEAQRKGILIVAAAGNKTPESPTYSFYPAAYNLSHVISVVGTNNKGQKLNTSNINHGKKNLYFPGKNIYSALPGNRFGRLTGSSQAAAKATAFIASIWMTKGKQHAFQKFVDKSYLQAKHP